MVRKFSYICDFNGAKHPVTFYIGDAAKGKHPLGFQSEWLSTERGGSVPKDLMDSLSRLKKIADDQKVPFENLCAYVIDEIQAKQSAIESRKKTQKQISEQVALQNSKKTQSQAATTKPIQKPPLKKQPAQQKQALPQKTPPTNKTVQ